MFYQDKFYENAINTRRVCVTLGKLVDTLVEQFEKDKNQTKSPSKLMLHSSKTKKLSPEKVMLPSKVTPSEKFGSPLKGKSPKKTASSPKKISSSNSICVDLTSTDIQPLISPSKAEKVFCKQFLI